MNFFYRLVYFIFLSVLPLIRFHKERHFSETFKNYFSLSLSQGGLVEDINKNDINDNNIENIMTFKGNIDYWFGRLAAVLRRLSE